MIKAVSCIVNALEWERTRDGVVARELCRVTLLLFLGLRHGMGCNIWSFAQLGCILHRVRPVSADTSGCGGEILFLWHAFAAPASVQRCTKLSAKCS